MKVSKKASRAGGLKIQTLGEAIKGIKDGAAVAVRRSHKQGLPFFEADSKAVYAVYPNGKRKVVQHLGDSRMAGVSAPYLIVVAGPNGAGKTTFAKKNLKPFIEAHAFLNADEIAREDNPRDVAAVAIVAGRKALVRRKDLLRSGKSLCIETTLAGSSINCFMVAAIEAG